MSLASDAEYTKGGMRVEASRTLIDFPYPESLTQIPPDESRTEGFSTAKSRSYNVVSLTAYLIGVRQEMFGRDFQQSVYDALEEKPNAKILRCLCIIRNVLLKHYKKIDTKITYDLCNLDRMADIISPEIFTYLSSQGVQVIKPNCRPMAYLLSVNTMIAEKVNSCQELYPLWVNWSFVRKLFLMPSGGKDTAVKKVIQKYSANLNAYPFHCYIDWPIENRGAYNYRQGDGIEEVSSGNILLHDQKFLTLLYKINNAIFQDTDKVRDVSMQTKSELFEFMWAHKKIAVVVDCENSDPYRHCAVVRNLKEYCLRAAGSEESPFSKITKIILYDDPHTVKAWQILSEYVDVPIEHVLIERVNDRKSLVDIRMTAGTCKEHYQNGVDAFLLASSDSDFWGLITALPTADFMVLIEQAKYGDCLKAAFDKNGIAYCFMDDFAGNITDIKTAALKHSIRDYLEERIQVNVQDMMDEIYEEVRMQMTDGEKRTFFDQYIKTLRMTIAADGKLSVTFKE